MLSAKGEETLRTYALNLATYIKKKWLDGEAGRLDEADILAKIQAGLVKSIKAGYGKGINNQCS